MTESNVPVTHGSGSNVDTFTLASSGNKRQAVVVGDSSIDANVAPVQSTDPTSAQAGLVVRDVNTSAIVAVLNSGVAISGDVNRVRNVVDGTLSTVTRVSNVVDGTISSLGTLTRVDRVINLVDGTLSTVGRVNHLIDGTVTVTGITASIGVYFDRSQPTVTVLQGGVAIGNSGVVGATTQRMVHATDVGTSVQIIGVNTSNTLGVYISATAGTLGVDVGKMQQADFVTRVRNIVDGTLTTVTGVDRVRNVVDGTISLVTMAQRVNNVVDGTLSMVQRVNNVVDGTIGISKINGNAIVAPNAGIMAINVYSTANIFTVAGSTSGGTTSGVTLVSPSANASFKVFAFSLQTTGIVGSVWRFCNGSGASQTEFFRGLATANQTSSTPIGANLAVQPPGFLFATGVSTTLALVSDTGSLVHYTVSYFKESA